MKRISIFIFLLILILLTSALSFSQWKGKKEIKKGVIYMSNSEKGLWQGSKKLVMEEIFTIGVEEGDDEYLLSMPICVETDSSDNIYIADMQDDFIKVYDNTGKFLRQIGRRGQGPGEFQELLWMSFTPTSKICVNEDYGPLRKISILTLTGDFIRSFVVNDIIVSRMAGDFRGETLFFTRKMPPLNFKKFYQHDYYFEVYQYDMHGKLINKFCELEGAGKISGIDHYAKWGYIATRGNGDLLIAFSYPYIIKLYDTKGNHKKTITKKSKAFKPPRFIEEEIVPGRRIGRFELNAEIRNILVLPDDNFLIRIFNRDPDLNNKNGSKTFYDLFDSEGHFLQSFFWNERIIHVDDKGFAYTITSFEDIPKVKKYKMSFSNK